MTEEQRYIIDYVSTMLLYSVPATHVKEGRLTTYTLGVMLVGLLAQDREATLAYERTSLDELG